MRAKQILGAWNYRLSSESRQRKFDLFWSEMKPWPGCSVLNLGAAPPHMGGTLMGVSESTRVEQPEQDLRWRDLCVTGCNINRGDMRLYHHSYERLGFSAVIADGCRLPFPDRSFDIVFSNAVIEHLTPPGQQRMASEILRVGRAWFVTTPNYWYPIEMHHKLPLFQFLPAGLQESIRRKYHTWPDGEPISLLTAKQLAALFPGSRIVKTRVTFHPETLIALRPLEPSLADFVTPEPARTCA